jgi:hemolysin activation/secretion protein
MHVNFDGRGHLARALAIALLALAAGEVFGQAAGRVDAGALQRRSIDTLEQQRREQQLREAEDAARRPSLAAPPTPALEVPPALRDHRFRVTRIELDDSAALTADELAAIRQRYEGREIAFAELAGLIDAINALYAEKNLLGRAVLPPQRIRDGVVKVRLVEARIGAVRVEDNRSTASRYVTDRVRLDGGDLVRLDALRDRLVDFNLRNDVNLRAELAPGAEFGTTDIVLKAIEPPRFEADLGFDNAGAESVGEERATVNLVARSLSGYRERLVAAGLFTEGSRTGSLLLDVPVWRRGTRIGVGFDASDTEIEDDAFAGLDIGGNASTLTLQLSHPFLATPAMRVDGILAYRAKHSATDFFDIEIADIAVRSLEYGATLMRFDERGTWFTQHTLTSGISGIGSDQSFLLYRGDVQRWQRLRGDLQLRLRVTGQWADIELLPPSEQFQLGGRYTVRGFREGLLIGDTGYLSVAELRAPLPVGRLGGAARAFAGKVDGRVFIDHGGAFPFKGAGGDITAQDYLTSAGFGIDLSPVQGVTAELAWSFPIGFRDDDEDYRFIFLVQVGLGDLADLALRR